MHPVIIGTLCTKLFTYSNQTMFPSLHGNHFQSVFKLCDNFVNSTAADLIHVDPINGTAYVVYKDGGRYFYKNVSRRAILKFIIDDARSFGKFINNVLKQQRVVCA